jgi:phage shock protein C
VLDVRNIRHGDHVVVLKTPYYVQFASRNVAEWDFLEALKMFCSHCGKQTNPGADFCPACGAVSQPAVVGRAPHPGQLTRPRHPRMIAGVCAGLALHFGWNLSLVRALMIVLTGLGLLAYVVAWVVIPDAPYIFPEQRSAPTPGVSI